MARYLAPLMLITLSLLGGCANPHESWHEHAGPALNVAVYNPGDKGIFAVSSELVTGKQDAILIDTQFATADAQQLVERIKASGKHLTVIYISHGDPDYYFGLDTLHSAFPDAKMLATPQTIAHIQATQEEKLKIWGAKLGTNAPQRVVIPEALEGDHLMLEGNTLNVIGLDGPTPERTYIWIPAIKTVVGGVSVFAGEHVWMADTQTPQSHLDWLSTLSGIEALQPLTVVPGHFDAGAPQDLKAVRFTAEYIATYDTEAAKAKNSTELIDAMKAHYPKLGAIGSLELSAKVSKGEIPWH